MKKLTYCVYVLYSHTDGNLYVGYTTDLKRRLTEHMRGKSLATAPRRPIALIFCEFFLSRRYALRCENYFKTTKGKAGLKLIIRESLHLVQNSTIDDSFEWNSKCDSSSEI